MPSHWPLGAALTYDFDTSADAGKGSLIVSLTVELTAFEALEPEQWKAALEDWRALGDRCAANARVVIETTLAVDAAGKAMAIAFESLVPETLGALASGVADRLADPTRMFPQQGSAVAVTTSSAERVRGRRRGAYVQLVVGRVRAHRALDQRRGARCARCDQPARRQRRSHGLLVGALRLVGPVRPQGAVHRPRTS